MPFDNLASCVLADSLCTHVLQLASLYVFACCCSADQLCKLNNVLPQASTRISIGQQA